MVVTASSFGRIILLIVMAKEKNAGEGGINIGAAKRSPRKGISTQSGLLFSGYRDDSCLSCRHCISRFNGNSVSDGTHDRLAGTVVRRLAFVGSVGSPRVSRLSLRDSFHIIYCACGLF